MKLDIDCVRDVLLELEELPIDCHTPVSFPKSNSVHGEENVEYTLAKLKEAGYINADIRQYPNGQYDFYGIYDLTFSGHEFLNSIRTPGVWTRLKGAAVEGGTAGLKLLGDIALEMLKESVKSKLGL